MDTKIFLVLSAAIFVIVILSFLFRFIVLYQKRMIEFAMEKDAIESRFQRELLHARLEIQEQTFKTISQEIHDNIGQMLSLAKLNLNRIDASRLDKDEEKVKDAKELVSKSIQDLRDLSRTLNTDIISSVGLLQAIQMELHLLQKPGSIQTRLEVKGKPVRMDAQKELILFRIYQEALHNVIEHAIASEVVVTAAYAERLFELIIADNGKGFGHAPESSAGSGLQNMKSRSQLIGATWQVTSTPENGTRIHISLPLTD